MRHKKGEIPTQNRAKPKRPSPTLRDLMDHSNPPRCGRLAYVTLSGRILF
ncbi:MAG: hypothetical protein LBE12_18880 [Planctomycetaceae bacterium]|nr:hypothetical protein [Planctomycetaceae bacterium]